MAKKGVEIAEPKGKLGVLMPGMGAVATTFIAGVEAIRRQLALPIGSLTQMGTLRLGKRTEARTPSIRDFVPLAGLKDLEFGGWDIFHDDAYEAAVKAGVLEAKHLDPIHDFLAGIKPMPAVFEQRFVKNLKGENIKKGKTKLDLAEQVMEDIRDFRKASLQSFGNRAVVLATPAQQQRLIGRLLDQRMAEHIAVRRRACRQHDLRGDQPPQLSGKGIRRLPGCRAQQRRPELPSDDRGNLGKLLGIRSEPVEAR